MGKGAYVTILNETQRTYAVEFDAIDCMYQDEEGSDFKPISGTIRPGGKLPVDGESQYIEKNASAFSTCGYQNGYFSLYVKDSVTDQWVARLKFEADKHGYRVAPEDAGNDVSDLGYGVSIDLKVTSGDADRIAIRLRDKQRIKGYPFWKVLFDKNGNVVFKSGLDALKHEIKTENITDLFVFVHGMNNPPSTACDLYENYFDRLCAKAGDFAPHRIGLLGVLWPSQLPIDLKSFIPFLGNPALLAARLATIGVELNSLLSRAPAIGRDGLAPVLTNLAAGLPALRIHLFGHSMGARLSAWTLKGLPQSGPASPIKSVFLAQGAVWSKIFQSDNDLAGCGAKVDGPLVATLSSHDLELEVLRVVTLDNPLGKHGFEGVNTHTVPASNSVTHRDFEGHKFIDLSCDAVIHDHNDYKKDEVALAHLLAARLK